MLELILVLFGAWVLWGIIKLVAVASWGLLKLLGIVLSVIAFPILFIGVLVVGVGKDAPGGEWKGWRFCLGMCCKI